MKKKHNAAKLEHNAVAGNGNAALLPLSKFSWYVPNIHHTLKTPQQTILKEHFFSKTPT